MLVCGVDEAGRGPIAGPVASAAVILPDHYSLPHLDDSKKLAPSVRRKAASEIKRLSVAWSVGWASVEEIERLNIHRATLLSMARAVRNLETMPCLVLVDGLFAIAVGIECRAVVRGDSTVPQIQAASIIAKTERDRWMARYARIEPAYLFEKHKGYPTEEHRRLVSVFGRSVIHRRRFRIASP